MTAAAPETPLSLAPNWSRRFVWLAVGLLVFRVFYLWAFVDFELAGDEAYYFDWGRQPDWCYFSKPPLIGWLMGLLRVCFGYHWWVIRLAAAVFAVGTLSCIFLLGRALYDAKTGFIAALFFLLTPAFSMLSIGFTIDAPLMLLWSASLLAFWKVVQAPSFGRWLLLTLLIGFGILAKQMMLLFPVLMVLFIALSPVFRPLLRRPALWLSIAGSLLFMLPVIWWNIQHDWITAKHTAEHFASEASSSRLLSWLEFFGKQAAFYSVIIWVITLVALYAAIRRWSSLANRELFLLLFSAPGLAVVIVLALRQEVNENWPGVYYLSALVFAAAWCPAVWQKRAMVIGFAVVILLHASIPLLGPLGLKGGPSDPLRDARGFAAAGKEIGQLLAKVPRPERTFVYVLGHRYNASQLAFHLPQHPRVYRWSPSVIPESQYEIWSSGADKIGWDAFIIDPVPDNAVDFERRPNLFVRWKNFSAVHRLGTVEVPLGAKDTRRFNIWLGTSMRRWPAPEAVQLAEDPELRQLIEQKGKGDVKQ